MNYYNKLFKKISLLQNGTLHTYSTQYTKPIPEFESKLQKHQRILLHYMKSLEKTSPENMMNPIKVKYETYFIDSQMGILADQSGTEKFQTILALLLSKPYLPNRKTFIYQQIPFVCVKQKENLYVYTNLYIIPDYLLQQYKQILKKQKINYYCISKLNNLKSNIQKYHNITLVIITISMLSHFTHKYGTNYCVSRIIFDQPQFVLQSKKIKSQFYWFSCSNCENLLFPLGYYWKKILTKDGYEKWDKVMINGLQKSHGFIKNIFYHLSINDFSFLQCILLKCSDELLNESRLQSKKKLIMCSNKPQQQYLQQLFMENVNLLQYNNIISNLSYTLCNKNECIEKITRKLQTIIESKQTKSLPVDNLKLRITQIKKTILNITKQKCSICHEYLQEIESSPICITDCCNYLFCFSCFIQNYYHSIEKSCPICKKEITNFYLIQEHKVVLPMMTKTKTILNLIQKNKKIIIYCNQKTNFKLLIHDLNKNNIPFACLKRNTINSIYRKMKNNSILCLLLTESSNLPEFDYHLIDHLIFYHPIINTLQEQTIISQIQTTKKQNVLQVYYLQYSDEII